MLFMDFQQSGVRKSSTAKTWSSISNLKNWKILKHSLSKPGLVMLSHVRPGLSNKVSLSGGSLAELLEQLPWCHANPRTLWVWLQLLHRLSSDIWRLEGAGSLLKSWFQSLKMHFACLRFSLGMKWNTMKWYEFALRQLPLSYQHCQASQFSIDDSDSILCLAWEQFELHLTVGSEIWWSPVCR